MTEIPVSLLVKVIKERAFIAVCSATRKPQIRAGARHNLTGKSYFIEIKDNYW
jgi:hypothetical protein